MNLFAPLRPVLLAVAASLTAAPLPEEYEVKAKILRIIGSYITWPRQDGADPNRPFTLVVLGRSPFHGYLEEACRTKTILNRKIQVVYLDDFRVQDRIACDLLFITSSETGRLPRILALCKNHPIFTIGDSPEFARRGVMLNMLVTAGTVNLEVNLKGTRDAGFEISPAFLALSKDKTKIVTPE